MSHSSAPWKKPLLAVIGVLIILAMLRAGVWQLDRAEFKRQIVEQLQSRSEQPVVTLKELIEEQSIDESRFRKVSLTGRFVADKTIFVDNQVVNGQVGYQVYTPFRLAFSPQSVLVARGWVAVGASRMALPEVATPLDVTTVVGRLNLPPAKPPIWNDRYSASEGQRWQFLPMPEVAEQLGLDLFPLVVELAPIESGAIISGGPASESLLRQWPEIGDEWVAKHQAYAFQWFAMAVAFFVACTVLSVRTSASK